MTEDFKSYYFDLIKKYYKTIPCWVNYLAVDANGYVYGYSKPPKRCKQDARWLMISTDNSEAKYLFCIANAYPIKDWEYSLISLKKFAKEDYINQIKQHMHTFPDWVKYVVVDRFGNVSGYESKPEINGLDWELTARNRSLFKMADFATHIQFADSLIALEDIENIEIVEDSKTEEINDNTPVLTLKLWKSGNTTLIGNIIEAKNIPANNGCIHYGIMDAFLYDDGRKGLIINSSIYRTPKDMVMVFKTIYERKHFIEGLMNNIKTIFGSVQYTEATKDDIEKEVYIDTSSNEKGILKAITVDDKYVVEVSELRIVDKVYTKHKNKFKCNIITQPDTSYIFEIKG